MEDFIFEMENYVSNKIDFVNQASYQFALANFRNWQNQPNKHLVTYYYSDYNFGLCYVQNLYGSRVESFYEVLFEITTNLEVELEMKRNLSITSFGCGPGPEIAAYISFLRSKLYVEKRLNFLAVDKIGYWRDFVNVITKCDSNITLAFQNATLSASYLLGIRDQGVCIMSYPEAVNFGDIWDLMIKKFRLIIILDQSKQQLHCSLRETGFTICNFTFRGQKSYAYYLTKNRKKSYGALPVRATGTTAYDSYNTYSTLPVRVAGYTPYDSYNTYGRLPVRATGTTTFSSNTSVENNEFWNMLGKCTIL